MLVENMENCADVILDASGEPLRQASLGYKVNTDLRGLGGTPASRQSALVRAYSLDATVVQLSSTVVKSWNVRLIG